MTFLFLTVLASTFTVGKHKPLKVTQKFQKAGANEEAANIFRGTLYLSGVATKKIKIKMAAMTRSGNRTT